MNKPNTNYGLRIPADDEMRRAFGSLAACVRVTGGDLPTILFCVANPDWIGSVAASVPMAEGDFAEGLRAMAAAEEWDSLEKPTIAAVSESIGVCRQVTRRALVAAGKWAA